MRRTIYLARHGETDWNRAGRWQGHTDIALSDMGRQQAQALARVVGGLGVHRVGSSDLARATETAAIVAEALGLPPVWVDAGLRERGFGCFEGLTRAECEIRYPEAWARYRDDARQPPPGGEPTARVVTRMTESVRTAARTLIEDEGAVLLVSHGGAMRTFLSAITGELPPPLGNGAVFRVVMEADAFGAVERIV